MKDIWRDEPPRTTNPLRFFLYVSRPHLMWALIATLCVIAGAGARAVVPYMYKLIIDHATQINAETFPGLIEVIVIYVLLALGSNLLWRLSGFSGMLWATGARSTARAALSAHVSKHSYEYFSDRFAGALSNKIKQAGDGVREFAESYLWQFLSFFVSVLTSGIIVFATSPIIGLILVALFVVITPLNIVLARGRIPLATAGQAAETKLNGATVDIITNMNAVHEYARRDFELGNLKELIWNRRKLGLRTWRYSEWVLVLNNILQTAFTGGMLLFAAYLALNGSITAGDLILFLSMISLLEDQLTFIGSQFNHLAENWGTVKESLQDIMNPHTVVNATDARILSASDGSIAFDNVSFDYEGVSVFDGLSFTIPAGQKVGVVGRSGAGKTTLIKLILRHYDIMGGRILVGGENIAQVTKDSLRGRIAIVPQEPALFHRSIEDNIAYGRTDATREEVIAAAKLAQADEFITAIPKGYDVLVGERGIKLSGGQRQRVAIARALIKDAPILLLDEATSALDSESEAAVQKALLKLMEGRTVIAIAHRLSTLRAMDRLLVFEAGKIIEDGTHEELLAKGGRYADLWNHQAGGFLED